MKYCSKLLNYAHPRRSLKKIYVLTVLYLALMDRMLPLQLDRSFMLGREGLGSEEGDGTSSYMSVADTDIDYV